MIWERGLSRQRPAGRQDAGARHCIAGTTCEESFTEIPLFFTNSFTDGGLFFTIVSHQEYMVGGMTGNRSPEMAKLPIQGTTRCICSDTCESGVG